MIVRATLSCIVSAALVAASGCCNPYVYRGCGAPCGGAGCGPCEEVVTARLPAPCVDSCGPACGDCGDCGPCGGCGYGCGWYPGKHIVEWLTCGAGCGGVYVNEWCNDPPECCDPCSPCGGYTGGACCVPLHAKFWAAILGEPCCEPFLPTVGFVDGCCPDACCGEPGCDSCGGGEMMMGKGGEVIIEKGGVPMGPAPTIVPGSPAESQTEDILVPERAPVHGRSAKAATYGKQRRVYYPYGRVRSR